MTSNGVSIALPNGYNLGEYQIESVLGKGGFGITYLARDTKLGARVAIKEYFPQGLSARNQQLTIAAKSNTTDKDYQWGLQQFLKEAQALARFKHNHIVRVLRYLEINGTAYMVMEYEQGQGLSDYLKQHGGRLQEPMLLQIFVPVLNGLQAVHSAGLLHLDIKPDNIYLRSDGQPILIDFGSARRTARGPDAEDRIALTPAYAAIEQYPDKGKQGPWTDIYSIGATMYHCISGKQPIDALRRYQTILNHKADPLTPAIELNEQGYSTYIRECIDWAIQIYPTHRPKGALQLQEGLMGQGRPNKKQTQPVMMPKQIQTQEQAIEKPTLKHKLKNLDVWKVTQGALISLVIVSAIAVSFSYWRASNRPRVAPAVTETESGLTAAEAEQFRLESIEKVRQAEFARQAALKADLPIFYRNSPIKLIHTLNGHQASVQSLAFLADGQQLASASEDGSIRVWDVRTGNPVRTLRGHRRSVHAIAVSPNSRLMVSAGNENDLFLWDMHLGQKIGQLTGHDYDVYTMCFSPDGRQLASAGKDQTIILWDVRNRKVQHILNGHEDTIFTLAFSADNNSLISGGQDGQLKRWDTRTGNQISSVHGHQGLISAVSFSPDGNWFASAGKNRILKIWNFKTGEPLRSLNSAPTRVNALVFGADSKQLVAAGSDNIIRIWLVDTGQVDHELTGHQDDIRSVVVSPDRKTLASAGDDKTVRIWQVQSN